MRFVFLSLALFLVVSANVVEKVAQQTEDAVGKAHDGKIRQCTCDEQHECVNELLAQGKQCMDDCFGKFKKITNHPDKIRECFRDAEVEMGSLATCFEDEALQCANEKTDKKVDKVDIEKLINIGSHKLLTAGKNLNALLSDDIKEITNSLKEFGLCTKNCVKEKNKDGYCFDKKECQPLIDEKSEAKKAAKKCAKEMDFKKHAGEICECSKKAGVEHLDKFCPVVNTVSEGVQDAVKGGH